jgi:hypothetical protein
MSATYDLDAAPLVTARDLHLPMTGFRLDLPTHGLTLRLPALWRRALAELALAPRRLASATQLLQDTVAGAMLSGKRGCAAVEALLCDAAGPPCAPVLGKACEEGQAALAAGLVADLADGPAGLDLTLAGFAEMDDPEGTLTAQGLQQGQLQGSARISGGAVAVSGALSGTRL